MAPESILVAGETLIDLIPVNGSSAVETDAFERRAGGAPANVAAGLAKLDAKPLLWTAIGDDGFGSYLESTLADTAISTRFITRRENAATGVAVVDDTLPGGFALYVEDTATLQFDVSELPETLLADGDWLHLGGVLFSREPARTAMFDLLDRAAETECTISFDPNYRPSIWPSAADWVRTLEEVLERIDVVIGHSGDFPTDAFPESGSTLAAAMVDRGVEAAFVTAGEAGAVLQTRPDARWGEHRCSHPGFDVTVEETTGAGDAFAAATIVGLRSRSMAPPAVLRFANACGALTTTRIGAIPALPGRTEVREWLQKQT